LACSQPGRRDERRTGITDRDLPLPPEQIATHENSNTMHYPPPLTAVSYTLSLPVGTERGATRRVLFFACPSDVATTPFSPSMGSPWDRPRPPPSGSFGQRAHAAQHPHTAQGPLTRAQSPQPPHGLPWTRAQAETGPANVACRRSPRGQNNDSPSRTQHVIRRSEAAGRGLG